MEDVLAARSGCHSRNAPGVRAWSTAGLLAIAACSCAAQPRPGVDAARMLQDLEWLATDARGGRRVGTEGNRAARAYIVQTFQELGLQHSGDGYVQPFAVRDSSGRYTGANVVGYLTGTASPRRFIVVSAHFDHLGVGPPDATGDSIYNGADDNASGTAALMALARYFAVHRPRHSVLFAAMDAEELGLQGARAFIRDPPVPLEQIAVNVNMDMMAHSQRELYVAGTYHYPFLRAFVLSGAASTEVDVKFGHDTPEPSASDDWTMASDHGPFHEAGIPFLYFGVEDHPDYHRPSDDVATINPLFYRGAANVVLGVVLELDRRLDAIPVERI